MPLPPAGSKQYLVVSQTDEWFMGKFNPEKLQERLNLLAAEGWRVITATTSDVGTWFGSFAGGMRQEMVILMEREVTEAMATKLSAEAEEAEREAKKIRPKSMACPQCGHPGQLTSTPGVYFCGMHAWK